jgi:hypothetical protein
MNGDGVGDLAVGAQADDGGGVDRGAVWILFLSADGKVHQSKRISPGSCGFAARLDDSDLFGSSLALLGDLDGDGVSELAVGARGDDDGRRDAGAVWVLFFNSNAMVKAHQKLSETEGGLKPDRHRVQFGRSIDSLGDEDGDGIGDIAVGANHDDVRGRFTAWGLLLTAEGKVKKQKKFFDKSEYSMTQAIEGLLIPAASWEGLVTDMEDRAVLGMQSDNDGGPHRGAVWVLTGRDKEQTRQIISATQGGFQGVLDDDDHFGCAVAAMDDLDGDGVGELAVGASGDDDGGLDRGALWVLFLNPDGTVRTHQKISATEGGLLQRAP